MIRLQDVIEMTPKVVELTFVTGTQRTMLVVTVVTAQDEQETVFGEEQFDLSKEDIEFLSTQNEIRIGFLE